MMLNFYGLRIVDYKTGELDRTEEWEDRFLNLNYCSHNNLRISACHCCPDHARGIVSPTPPLPGRILIALGEHGFGRYKRTFLARLREEIEEKGQMPECAQSLKKFWTFLVEEEDTPQYKRKTKEVPLSW